MSFAVLTAEDSEVFQRVWNRVMPDQSLSPVVIRQNRDLEPLPKAEPEGDYITDWTNQLEEIMDDVQLWHSRLERLAGQNGGKTALRTLCEGERHQLKKLAQLYFLMTGGRYIPPVGKIWGRESKLDSLRRGFYLEMEWVEFYDQLSNHLPQIGLKELALELKTGALEQGRGIRGMV